MAIKRALVTGANGFVGRHMCETLSREGYIVVGIDINASERGDYIDVLTRIDARKFFTQPHTNFDVVVHAAAHVGGRIDIENKAAFIAAYNLQLDGALFEWALKAQPKHLVYLSSSAAYPIDLQDHHEYDIRLREDYIDLDRPFLPDQTYGWVKLTGEIMANEYASEATKWNGRVHVVRPFSGYGSDQDVTYPFAAFIERALAKEDPFIVWGNGEQVRDFIHIDDVCNGIMAVIEQDITVPVNLCTGRATSMHELAVIITGATHYIPVINAREDMPTGVVRRVGEPTRMQKIYMPKIRLEEGIRRAIIERK